MARWYVVTPEYTSGGDEIDPPETGCDVIMVSAPTRKDAIREGVCRMLAGNYREYKWCRDARSDRRNPFAGVRALPVEVNADGNYAS